MKGCCFSGVVAEWFSAVIVSAMLYMCRPGRPVTKKAVSDRKAVGRPRRVAVGNSVAVLSGTIVIC